MNGAGAQKTNPVSLAPTLQQSLMARLDRLGTARVRPPLGGPIAEKGSYPGGSARPAQDPASGSQSSANPDPGPPTPHPVIDVGSSWVLLRKKGSWGGPAGGVERTRSTGSCALAGDRPVRAVGTPGCRSSDAAPPALGATTHRSAPARRASSSAAARTDSADTVSNTPRSSLARSFAAWASRRVALLTPTAQRRAARVGGFQPSACARLHPPLLRQGIVDMQHERVGTRPTRGKRRSLSP